MEPIEQAIYLHKKFGNSAIDVVEEILKYDRIEERYYWQCVINELMKL